MNERMLLWASAEGNVSQIERLLSLGARVDTRDENGATPLHLAVKRNHLGAVDILLARGANPNALTKFGDAPLHLAALFGNSSEVVARLVGASASIDLARGNGTTPLHIAARTGNIEVLRGLLDGGARVAARTDEGFTALTMTAMLHQDRCAACPMG